MAVRTRKASKPATRFGESIAGAYCNEELGEIVGCDVFGSSSWAEHHPDLYLFGVRFGR